VISTTMNQDKRSLTSSSFVLMESKRSVVSLLERLATDTRVLRLSLTKQIAKWKCPEKKSNKLNSEKRHLRSNTTTASDPSAEIVMTKISASIQLCPLVYLETD